MFQQDKMTWIFVRATNTYDGPISATDYVHIAYTHSERVRFENKR